jgi:glycosyltransferase involved in cell wall biosynthesis/ubiquinone/menaquinone biosynthesis C-methylase UbiE
MMSDRFRCLYRAPSGAVAEVEEPRLAGTTERHKLRLVATGSADGISPTESLNRDPTLAGLVCEMHVGWVGRELLHIIGQVLRRGRRVWLYWPEEEAVECVDRERLASHWRHWLFIQAHRHVLKPAHTLIERYQRVRKEVPIAKLPAWAAARTLRALRPVDVPSAATPPSADRLEALRQFEPAPVAIHLPSVPSSDEPLPGVGVYLRSDFWVHIESGGSYGHTCYVAKELAAVCDQFVAFLPCPYPLLDDYGVHQIALDAPSTSAPEDVIAGATDHYFARLKPALQALRPSFIYERLCLGNYAGALLSRMLGIPYIVEYNGSEISMRKSFDGVGYVHEAMYLKAEEVAFAQATAISVVSEQVRASLLARGVDPSKVLVNPNGVDPDVYSPPTSAEKHRIRERFGFTGDDVVVGFTGTFGGWHGIDVLAAAIPQVCQLRDDIKFLLIGDGALKHLIDAVVEEHGLESRVVRTGRVPQRDGAVMLKACDILVSPHNSHMVDSRFFGSPTKIFEYMSVGAAIVASDLEQIGQTLSPALSPADVARPDVFVADERAVLCPPGDVPQFVQAVVNLAGRPMVRAALGASARAAVLEHYSWKHHVQNLWRFVQGEHELASLVPDLFAKSRPARAILAAPAVVAVANDFGRVGAAPNAIPTGDAYKDETQRQWDNDPVGSQYVKDAAPHTLDWFLEAEAYRYREYAPWMAEVMEFGNHEGAEVLEIGGGMGTDLAQFALHGAQVTDLDLSSGHLEHARENFRLRGLSARFLHDDAERLPFNDNTFDVVYSNGVLHHMPNTRTAVAEIFRVLKPGGRAIVMMYAENSWHYWRRLVGQLGLTEGRLETLSMGEIMSRSVERSDNSRARPLVKVYTRRRLASLFDGFTDVKILQRQMVGAEVPRALAWVPLPMLGKIMGWNLIIKARKPLV